ncbi:dihydroorotase [Dyadobacter chenwenxiniae]|uniref:Dihydroorotase n=1 Tax=Dyadobacter chenwenxiniae TaxID=2906456 RepID=A0A9X1PSW6_9BACT|nr:dihydroorotase [Dyadobacter chenwenxiniae]MCF0051366.1 dihydroorotase [Dyadobacter chenwenxiniae]MCF0065474.1 dihydroorotase [Dyadobacter chenwenxiniae]UON82118.1 dihydroorotase [Dyadobacter chenwenxiniae]
MTTLIVNAQVVNENEINEFDVIIENGHIHRIGKDLQHVATDRVIDAKGQYLMPGVIDDQVHFREPGLTYKANIYTESKAAVAGGVTSFMEMPNTVPNALTQELLADKYKIGAETSLANYSFFMGASNDNYEEVMKTNPAEVCGIKIFMGSSTGNMLVDAPDVLEKIFSNAPCIIATHCEDEPTVRQRMEHFKEKYGENVPYNIHALIRNEEACLKSSTFASGLAHKHGTRLHILHISTGDEVVLFEPGIRKNGQILLSDGQPKLVTAEACVHHLWFDAEDYHTLGNKIKCNPAIKAPHHKEAILQAVLDNRIDVIATDHAPHTIEEKAQGYWQAPSGLPLVQHTLNVMLELNKAGKISIERIVEKMSHTVADLFQISKRGYIREGYWADLILVDTHAQTNVEPANIYSKCGWSPFEGMNFQSSVTHTFVSGNLVYENGKFNEKVKGQRLLFSR